MTDVYLKAAKSFFHSPILGCCFHINKVTSYKPFTRYECKLLLSDYFNPYNGRGYYFGACTPKNFERRLMALLLMHEMAKSGDLS